MAKNTAAKILDAKKRKAKREAVKRSGRGKKCRKYYHLGKK